MSNNIIDSIQLSGTVYTIQGTGGGGSPTVELTQAEYDALVSAGTVSANTYYIITDAQSPDISLYWTSAQTQSAINAATSGKVNTSSVASSVTSASTDSEIPTAKAVFDAIPQGGGGKAIEAGRGIAITTGATADTVSFNLPISAGTGVDSVLIGFSNSDKYWMPKATANGAIAAGAGVSAMSECSFAFGYQSKTTGNNLRKNSFAHGYNSIANGSESHAEGSNSIANGSNSHAEGKGVLTNNEAEHSQGQYNNSVSASTTFGDSGNTLFSVGNGTSSSARHNAFEIRQNGDIYLTSGGTDIKLQDHLGGGGSSINVVQTTGSSTTDVMSQDAVTTQLSGYVTTDTSQDITGTKTFVGEKKIKFKQSSDSNKLGFTLYNSASTNNEIATFEFRPNTYTDSSSVSHPLLYIGHYRNTNTANAGVAQTMVGFRQYDQKGAAAYHYLMPLPAEAKTPFSLTTSFKNYFAPLGFKNGSTMITTDNTGVADFSSVLGGLKLVKLSQSDYDALTTKDDNTVYFIGDSTNGYTMKIGSANVN